jgi:hypothetical protein
MLSRLRITLSYALLAICLAATPLSAGPNPPSNYPLANTPYSGTERWYCTQAGVDVSCNPTGINTYVINNFPPFLPSPYFTSAGAFPGVFTQLTTDTNILRDWGYIANGASHPLSSVTFVNNINTTGFTLGQWQAFLPAATALTDEIDWCAVQSYINAAAGPIVLKVPVGEAFMNHPVTVANNSVSIFGGGGINQVNLGINPGSQSWWHFTAATDGIDHTGANSKIELHNIMLDQTTFTGTILGINDSNANNTVLEHVLISGWNNGISLVNARGTKLEDVVAENRQAAGADATSIGLEYSGNAAFINHGHSVLMQGFAKSYYYHSIPAPTFGLEDIVLSDSACGGTWKCIIIDSATTTYGPFNYAFYNMSVDASGQFLSLPECNDVIVNGGNWLIDAAVGSWPGSLNMIDIGSATTHCNGVRLRDMWVGNQTVATINTLVLAEADATDVQISGFHIETNNVTTLAGWYYVLNGAIDISEQNTNWYANFARINPPALATGNTSVSPTNRFQSAMNGGPPVLSGCGGGASINAGATASHGTITEGAGATGCTWTFANPLPVVPSCQTTNTQAVWLITENSVTNAAVTITQYNVLTGGGTGALTLVYDCTY